MFIEILAYDAPDLYYYRARYYDPNTTRFLSQDPIEFLSGDFNFYRYVGSDPVNFVDPSGLAQACSIAVPQEKPKLPVMSSKKVLSKVAKSGPYAVIMALERMFTMGIDQIGAIEADIANRGGSIPKEDELVGPEYIPERVRKQQEKEACEEKDKAATETKEGALVREEEKEEDKQKCKRICFDIASDDSYPIAEVPKAGIKSVVGPVERIGGTADYQREYIAANGGSIPTGAAMHHITPLWAGGCELCGNNLVPLDKPTHTQVHQWWNEKIKQKNPEINDKIEKCAQQNGQTGQALNACKTGEGNQHTMPNAKTSNVSVGERGIGVIANCLRSQGVDLQVAIDSKCGG